MPIFEYRCEKCRKTFETLVFGNQEVSCPKCKDTWVKVVQPMGKGGRQETANIQRHECPGCDTKIVTEGVGKQAKSVVKHTCKQCGSEDMSCCVMKKGAGPTPGMDEHKGHQH